MSLAPRIYVIFLIVLLVFSFLIRLIGWDDPYFGFHIGRQLSTLAVSEHYTRDGVNLIKPSPYYLTYGGHFLQELPIYQALSAWSSTFTETVLSASRGVNLFFALLTLPVVFQIAAIHFCRKTAIYSVLFFAFAPLNLMYHSALLIDISTAFFASLAYWLLAKYLKGNRNITLFFIFLLAGGYCVLVKPLYFLPSGVLLVTHFSQQWRKPRMQNLLSYTAQHRVIIGLFALITFSMLLWVGVQRQVNPNSYNTLEYLSFRHLSEIMFYVRAIFRGVLLVLNPLTFLFFIVGLFLLFRNHRRCEQMALIYSIIWFHLIFGTMVTPHEYYELPMVPFTSVIAGCGAMWFEGKIRSEFQIASSYMLSAGIILGTAICSVFLFSVNFIGAFALEQRAAVIEKEMHGVLEQEQFAYVYIDRTNFPISDYVAYNRTAKLKYFLGQLSKEQIRMRGEPVRPEEILYALKQYGDIEWVSPEAIPEVDVGKIQAKYQRRFRYLIFYRFSEEAKAQIKNRNEGYKLIYESEGWLVYDLASE